MSADTLPEWLNFQASHRPTQIAMRHKRLGVWEEKTWRAIQHETLQLVSALKAHGFARGDTLYLLSNPRPEALLLSLAAHWLGGVSAPLDNESHNAEFLALLQQLQPAFVFAEGQSQVDLLQQQGLGQALIIYADARGLATYQRGILQPYAGLINLSNNHFYQPPIGGAANDAFVFYRLNPLQRVERKKLSHKKLLTQGRLLIELETLTEREEALAARAFAASGHLKYLLAPWLQAGFKLNFPENINTRDSDRRELGPTLVAGTSSTYQRLESLVKARLPLTGTWRRALLDWSLATSAKSSPLRKAVAYGLIIRPLQDVIGLSRTRVPLLIGEALPESSEQFFQSLGINIRNWPDAPAWETVGISTPAGHDCHSRLTAHFSVTQGIS